MSSSDLEVLFPYLESAGFQITSKKSDRPNCIGYALYSDLYFDPVVGSSVGGYYWPPGIRRDDSVAAWSECFALHGYQDCDNGALEPDTEKIAIYFLSDDEATHVARQLPSGEWTSKLGSLEDIEHMTLGGLVCDDYGKVAKFMRRLRPATP